MNDGDSAVILNIDEQLNYHEVDRLDHDIDKFSKDMDRYADTGFNIPSLASNETADLLLANQILTKTFSELELMQFQEFKEAIEENDSLPVIIDLDLLTSSVKGQNIFSIFQEDLPVYELIERQLNESKDEESKDGGQASDEHLFNIKVILVLKKPTRSFS